MKAHKIEIGIILAALILISCTACNKENKSVPAMATVSSVSSDIGVSSLVDSVASSAVCSASSSSASSPVSKASSSSSSAASKSTGSSNKKASGGSTAKLSGGSTTKPSGGGSTGGTTTKQSGGGSTGGTTTKQSGGGSTGGGTVAPAPTDIKAQYYGATYGCTSQSQYDFVMSKVSAVTSSSRYQNIYADNASNATEFKKFYGVDYSDEMNKILSLGGYWNGYGGSAPNFSSTGNAYNFLTKVNCSCANTAKTVEATLHINGINARLAWGTMDGGNHMWVQACINGTWYNLARDITTSTPSGYVLWGTGYNY